MRHVPPYALLWIAGATVLGVLIATPLSSADRNLVAIAIALGAAALYRFPRETRQLRALAAAALVIAACYAHVREASVPSIIPTRTARYTAYVVDERAPDAELHTYVLALDNGFHLLASFTRNVPLGARLVVRGRLEPLDEARNPGEPSERAIEAEHGITGRLASAAVLQILDSSPNSIGARVAQLHARALALLRAHLPEPGASIVAGELWGDRSALPPELRTEFQETGTVHVLVTAGLHVGLIAWLVTAICGRLTLRRAYACVAAIVAVWIFAMFSGSNLPAIRAATMATAMLSARAFGRATLSWNSLALAAIAVVLIVPSSVSTPSFWLSFCCVGAIFACGPALEPIIDRVALDTRIREALLLTLSTQLGTWPISAATFLQFSPYAVLANVVVVPLVPATMLLGMLQLLATPLWPLAQAVANLNSWLLIWTVSTVHLLASLPGSVIRMTPAPTWCIALYECTLIAASALAVRKGLTISLGLLVVSTSLVLLPPATIDTRLRITVLDVGQADAIVIQTPAHHTILVDSGGRLERGPQSGDSSAERVGERIVVPFLLRQGIHQIDALIISHPHGDHVAGCAPVLRALRVAEIADSGQTYGGHAYHDCLDTATADHVPIVQPRAGMVWRTNDGVKLTFIGPSLPFIGGKNAINDNSVAFILQYERFRMLFTGDAGVAAEQRFLDEGIDLRSDVLKVGHHGSAYSSSVEFIAAVHPRSAIISVGRHNLFGHPAPSTINTLIAERGVVYRTDEDGGVTVVTDGTTSTVRSQNTTL